jgi:hypothetical protein
LNIVRQIGGSVAVATFAVVLQRQITDNLGPLAAKAGGSILSTTGKLPPVIDDKVISAFSYTFWWAVIVILFAFIPTLFLPNRPAQSSGGPPSDADGAVEAPAPGALID